MSHYKDTGLDRDQNRVQTLDEHGGGDFTARWEESMENHQSRVRVWKVDEDGINRRDGSRGQINSRAGSGSAEPPCGWSTLGLFERPCGKCNKELSELCLVRIEIGLARSGSGPEPPGPEPPGPHSHTSVHFCSSSSLYVLHCSIVLVFHPSFKSS